LLDAVSDQPLVGWETDFVSKGLREALDRSGAVGQLEHRGCGAVEAVGLLARQIVDDQLVGDVFGQHVGASSPGIRSRHDVLHELVTNGGRRIA
jgi:hypothetical protein